MELVLPNVRILKKEDDWRVLSTLQILYMFEINYPGII